MKKQIKSLGKNFGLMLLILLTVAALFSLFTSPEKKAKKISFTQLVEDINQDKVEKISVSQNDLLITYKGGEQAKTKKENEAALSQSLLNYGADIKKVNIDQEEKGEEWSWLMPILFFGILPLLFFGFFFWMIFKQAKTGAGQAFSFSKAKAKLFGQEKKGGKKTTFDDVGNLKEAKEELIEIVDFLKHPKKYLKMGAKIPRGVLLIGAPGTGKTLLARAVAAEANTPFFSISGSEFIELFVGVGSARVRDLFATARKQQPSIIFIDEIDAIGKTRGPGFGGGHEEREQTLNQILVEMDGFERESTCIVLAATNRPDVLDPALLRPGRFDRRVILDIPDISSRQQILKIHCQNKPLDQKVDLREVAERTPGFSGADLANLANEATLLAAKRNKQHVYQEELLESIEKVLLGPERKSHLLSKPEKRISAFHEAGHALVSAFCHHAEPIRKISIVSRGMAAGYILKTPKEEKQLKTKSEFLAEIATALGGCSAEKLIFGEITTGAANDLQKASDLARKMVKEYGMSKNLGLVTFGEKGPASFFNQPFSEEKNYSEKTAEQIDAEVLSLIKEAQDQASEILEKKKEILNKIAEVLIAKEVIEKEEFEELIKGT